MVRSKSHAANILRDTTADLLTLTSKDVQIEPILTKLTGEELRYKTGKVEDDARVDVSARNFWRFFNWCFLVNLRSLFLPKCRCFEI